MAKDRDLSLQTLEFKNFKGINNVANALDLTTEELTEANNIDLTSEGKATRRDGYTKKFTPSGTLHSLWSNDRIALFVDGTTLKRLLTDYTSTTIRSSVSTLPMSYVDVNEQVYYANASVIGYVDHLGVGQVFADPGIKYKQAPQPGQHIEYYNGRIYIARNETLWYTDAFAFGRVDLRTNAIPFKDEITMLRAVDDGLYVSIGDINDRSSVIFLKGSTPEEFVTKEIADYGAIEGTDVQAKGQFVGKGIEGKVVIWSSRKGICLGANGGNFQNLTVNRYKITRNRYGAGLFRLQNGLPQYIASLWT